MDIENRLLQLKKEIEKRKIEKAKLEGEFAQVSKQLQEMGCSNIQDAQQEIEAIKQDMEKNNVDINQTLTQLEGEVWS